MSIVVVHAPKASHRQINANGARLIKSFEGKELVAYPDPGTGGKPYTVGYGATVGIDGKPFRLGQTIDDAMADALFAKDIARFEEAVDDLTGGNATDNQFAAMVSLAFNVGKENFEDSTLLRKHRAGDYSGAANEFARWKFANGKVLNGLVRRRAAEAELYRS
ncbi:lysozyme [Croceicoccus sp. YJ47]|nr:lysozyme [Croceicoccus sp. YJ47]